MIKVILFDFDGTLARSNEFYLRAYLGLFKRYGIEVPQKSVLAHFGEDHRSVLKHFAPEQYGVLHRIYHKEVLVPSFYKKVKLLRGAQGVLTKLGQHYALGLCTGCPRRTLRYLQRHLQLHKYFDYLSCGDDVRYGKPAPDLLLRALRKMRVKPSEALYVGDAPRDYLSAKRAHIRFIPVLTGVLTRAQCRKLKIKDVLRDITELPRLLEKLN